MEPPNKYLLPERNPITHAKHRKEVFWQIIFPMLIGVLLVLVVSIIVLLSATHEATNLSRWADVSLIWLILPSLFFALLLLIFLGGVVYLVTVLLQITPRYACIIQNYFELGKYKVIQISHQITSPIVKGKSMWAVVRNVGKLGRQPPEEQG